MYKTPKIKYKDLLEQANIPAKQRHSVYCILKAYGITNWRSKKRPFLSEVAARSRLNWANLIYTIMGWDPYLPNRIIWSDECSIYQQGGRRGRGASAHLIGSGMRSALMLPSEKEDPASWFGPDFVKEGGVA